MYSYPYGFYVNPLNMLYRAPYTQYTAPMRHFLRQQNDHRRCISKAEADYMAMNRLLWMEHVNWTRMTIISIVFNLPDIPFVQELLLRNAIDLGNCIRPFYGDQIADRYAELIKEHLIIAAQLVTAAAKGDSETADAKEKEWYRNADDIAVFLNRINPYLSIEALQKMFYTHLALTKNEAVTMIQKDYKSDVQIFDDIEAEALDMSDMIAGAIVMQFCYLF
ncbi:hypothetical protein ACIQXF_06205 [Lysinibacillus sp. NPDC097231]|uniref:hypothetical protein n=1 Tax=Lysinibacillus sp. NPDC097231 TaxID=3364142 RepID=UPI0037FF91AA